VGGDHGVGGGEQVGPARRHIGARERVVEGVGALRLAAALERAVLHERAPRLQQRQRVAVYKLAAKRVGQRVAGGGEQQRQLPPARVEAPPPGRMQGAEARRQGAGRNDAATEQARRQPRVQKAPLALPRDRLAQAPRQAFAERGRDVGARVTLLGQGNALHRLSHAGGPAPLALRLAAVEQHYTRRQPGGEGGRRARSR
jgi:hypothetical protein